MFYPFQRQENSSASNLSDMPHGLAQGRAGDPKAGRFVSVSHHSFAITAWFLASGNDPTGSGAGTEEGFLQAWPLTDHCEASEQKGYKEVLKKLLITLLEQFSVCANVSLWA